MRCQWWTLVVIRRSVWTMKNTPRVYLTRQEAAERAHVGVRTIDRWRSQNLLTTYYTRAHQVRLDAKELDELTSVQPEPLRRKSA